MEESINASRRGFLSRITKPAQQLIEQDIEPTPRTVARPPRALDEALFVRQCDGCGKCQVACESSVIEMADGLPVLNLDYNDCSLCDACTNACETGALNRTQPLVTELKPSFSNNCSNYMMESCSFCLAACSEGAISIEEGELPSLDTKKCIGCGDCRTACVTGCVSLTL